VPKTPWPDGLRFAFGTLTVLPVKVTRWDRDAARGGMLCAPVAGLVVGGCAALAGVVLVALGAGALLAAVASAAVPAVLTRGLHLDGLADTADGLGPLRDSERALQVMRQSDVGPFGVATLVLTLLLQIAAASALLTADGGWVTLGAAVGVGRLALLRSGLPGVPVAAGSTLGRAVAGTVSWAWWGGAVVAVVAAGCGAAWLVGGPFDTLRLGAAAVIGLLAAEVLHRRATARLGGTTGDVMGAMAEVATTAHLLVAAALWG
jgi:adenosylcobinamide-GDP ribazoletransferase